MEIGYIVPREMKACTCGIGSGGWRHVMVSYNTVPMHKEADKVSRRALEIASISFAL